MADRPDCEGTGAFHKDRPVPVGRDLVPQAKEPLLEQKLREEEVELLKFDSWLRAAKETRFAARLLSSGRRRAPWGTRVTAAHEASMPRNGDTPKQHDAADEGSKDALPHGRGVEEILAHESKCPKNQ